MGPVPHPVPSEIPARPRAIVIGEGPGGEEERQGRPFVGKTGELLDRLLAHVDLPRGTVAILNATKCMPHGKDDARMSKAVACCRPALAAELARLPAVPILACGKWALASLTGKATPIGQARGFLRGWAPEGGPRFPVIGTFHPASTFPFRSPTNMGPLMVDMKRWADLARGHLRPYPDPVLLLSIEQPEDRMLAAVRGLHARALQGTHVAVDIETAGAEGEPWRALQPDRAALRTLGMGTIDLGVSIAWPPSADIREACRALLADPRAAKVFHNGLSFDIPVLRRHGLDVA